MEDKNMFEVQVQNFTSKRANPANHRSVFVVLALSKEHASVLVEQQRWIWKFEFVHSVKQLDNVHRFRA
jgi:hypothetical protein